MVCVGVAVLNAVAGLVGVREFRRFREVLAALEVLAARS